MAKRAAVASSAVGVEGGAKGAGAAAPASAAATRPAREIFFRVSHYCLSVHLSNALLMLLAAAFFLIPVRPQAVCGAAAIDAAAVAAAGLGYDAAWAWAACRAADVCVWAYVALLTVCVALKWWHYKGLGWHYFVLDYCYIHIAVLIVYFAALHVDLSSAAAPRVLSSHEVAAWTAATGGRGLYAFAVLLSGSLGPILGAVYMWANALLLQDLDKMSSCILHFAPPAVQLLWLHFLLHGPARALAIGAVSHGLAAAVLGHAAMFWTWQAFHYGFIEMRFRLKPGSGGGAAAPRQTKDKEGRVKPLVTSFTWMMERPPGGFGGWQYRFVTSMGSNPWWNKFLFAVIQCAFHLGCVLLGYVAVLCVSKLGAADGAPRTWALLAYLGVFYALSVRAAGNATKRIMFRRPPPAGCIEEE
jgi:hypothetical protein